MVDISINEFQNKVIQYLKDTWNAETVKEIADIKHAWVSKWSRSEKIIVCTISRLPSVQWSDTQNKLIHILAEDESLPLRVILFSLFPFSEAKKTGFIQEMRDNNVEFEIFDSSNLANLEDFSSLYSTNKENTDEKVYNLLYRYLADSSSSSDIKNIILRSVIIFSLYEEKQMLIQDLQQRVKQKLGKQNISIQGILNKLVREKRVEPAKLNADLYSLSSEERESVGKDILLNQKEKDLFIKSIEACLQKFEIPVSIETLIDKLLSVYKERYGLEVSKSDYNDNNSRLDILQELKSIMPIGITPENLKSFVDELYNICDSNKYIKRISQSESFLGLYKSERLEKYLSNRKCEVFLDTPEIVYFLCSRTGFVLNGDFVWDNYYFRTSQNLFALQGNNKINLNLNAYNNYVSEVAGEFRKGLRLAWFSEHAPNLPIPIKTGNTFYNFFLALKKDGKIDVDMTFGSFISRYFNIRNTDEQSESFMKEAQRSTTEILSALNINTHREKVPSLDEEIRTNLIKDYDLLLYDDKKIRTTIAKEDDVYQAIYIAQLSKKHETEDTSYYFVSWDRSTIALKKDMKDRYPNLFDDYIVENPALLVNRLSLANFNVDSDSITYDVFTYADREFALDSKIKSLYDNVIIPLFGYSANGSTDAAVAFLTLQKTYLEQTMDTDDEAAPGKLPLEEVFDQIMKNLHDWGVSEEQLSVFVRDNENTSDISEILNDAFDKIKNHQKYEDLISRFGNLFREYVKSKRDEATVI